MLVRLRALFGKLNELRAYCVNFDCRVVPTPWAQALSILLLDIGGHNVVWRQPTLLR